MNAHELRDDQKEIINWLSKNGPAGTTEIANVMHTGQSAMHQRLTTLYVNGWIVRRIISPQRMHSTRMFLWDVKQ